MTLTLTQTRSIYKVAHKNVYTIFFDSLSDIRKVAGSIPDEVTGLFNWTNTSNRNMALESTQPLTEMNTRNLPEGKWRTAHKANNFTAICEPIV
jgi:hypothetical protein